MQSIICPSAIERMENEKDVAPKLLFFVGVQGADLSACNKTNYGTCRNFATEILCHVDQLSSKFLIHVEVLGLHQIFRELL
jgi:hypothetical protein